LIEDQHREGEVRHNEPRREFVLDRVAAEHRLRDHAERKRKPERHQVAPERPAPRRQERREHGHDADEAGDDAVRELNQRMGLERRVHVAIAPRPVRAAETGAAQANRRAAQDDQRQGNERRERDELELPRSHLERC